MSGDPGALWIAAVCAALAFVAVYLVAVWTAPGQWLDGQGFVASRRVVPPLNGILSDLARIVLPVLLAVLVAVLGVVEVARRAWRHLLAATLALGSVPLAWVLKARILPVPSGGDRIYPQSTYPAAHMAAVVALTVAVLILCPRPVQRLHVVAAAIVVAVAGFGNVTGYAHVPSDSVGSVLLVAAVTTAVVAVVRPRTDAEG